MEGNLSKKQLYDKDYNQLYTTLYIKRGLKEILDINIKRKGEGYGDIIQRLMDKPISKKSYNIKNDKLTTTIRIRRDFKETLDKNIKLKGESYSQIIWRLIKKMKD